MQAEEARSQTENMTGLRGKSSTSYLIIIVMFIIIIIITGRLYVLNLRRSGNPVKCRVYLWSLALCSRADHHIFMLWFVLLLSSFFSSANLSRRRLDVCHTCTHGVALVRI